MKNISTHVAIAVVSLVLVIGSAFLLPAPGAVLPLTAGISLCFGVVFFPALWALFL